MASVLADGYPGLLMSFTFPLPGILIGATPTEEFSGSIALATLQAGLGLTKVLTTLSWLIACGAVVYLWQHPSSVFFRRAVAPGRNAPRAAECCRPATALRADHRACHCL